MLKVTMFIQDFAHVSQPYALVRERMVASGAAWARAVAADAYCDGEELRLRVGPRTGGWLSSKAVRIDLGTPYDRKDAMVIPMSWVATGTPGLFPAMEADLEFAPVGAEMTQVTLSGMYEPPLGKVGKTVDVLLLHRLAEATVRSFLLRLADGLQRPLQDSATTLDHATSPRVIHT